MKGKVCQGHRGSSKSNYEIVNKTYYPAITITFKPPKRFLK